MIKQDQDEKLLPLVLHLEKFKMQQGVNNFCNSIVSNIFPIDFDSQTDPSKNLHSWNFNVLDLSVNEVYYFVWRLFYDAELIDTFNIQPEIFLNFIAVVEYFMSRHDNTYHNLYHSADVLHATYIFLFKMKGKILIDTLDVLCCFIASICHDLDHPGTNNAFQVNMKTSLALLYNDQSVLENHHCALAFKILNRKECDITAELDSDSAKYFRRTVISGILATDMSFHFKLKDEFDGCVTRYYQNEENGTNSFENVVDKEVFLRTLIHTADLSNPTKPWIISKEWSDRVVNEFFNQGDMEKAAEIPVSMNMDRDTTDTAVLSLGFIDFIIAPSYMAWQRLLPETKICCLEMTRNRLLWEDKLMENIKEKNLEDDEYKNECDKWERRREEVFKDIVGDDILNEVQSNRNSMK